MSTVCIKDAAAWLREGLRCGMSGAEVEAILPLFNLRATTPAEGEPAMARLLAILHDARRDVVEALASGDTRAVENSLHMLEYTAKTFGFAFCVLSANLLEHRDD